jgi:drug/metabolite transporter (DMT)-like permease
LKTAITLAVVIIANAAGNVVLGHGMRQVESVASYSPVELIGACLRAMSNPWVIAGVLLLMLFFAAHTLVLSWADLSYVLLITAIGYPLVALLSWWFLGEAVTAQRWGGTILITAGVMLVGTTPISTTQPVAPGDGR